MHLFLMQIQLVRAALVWSGPCMTCTPVLVVLRGKTVNWRWMKQKNDVIYEHSILEQNLLRVFSSCKGHAEGDKLWNA